MLKEIIIFIRQKFINYKKLQKRLQYKRGYNWASGALLREEETSLSIEGSYDMHSQTASPFDQGANDACNKLISLKIIEDDRI